MRGATAATFPPAMATSRSALTPFRGSMRWPPRRSRSYFGSAAAAAPAAKTRSPAFRRIEGITGSRLPRPVPPGRPPGPQVLAELQRPRHLVAGHLAGEAVVERVAVALPVVAADLHGITLDGAGEVAGDEVAPVRAVEVASALAQEQAVVRSARGILDVHVPLPREVGGGGGGRRVGGRRALGGGEDRVETVAGDVLVAGRHHVWVHRDAGEGGLGVAAGREHPHARVRVEQRLD